jgi:hypothetical protein
MQGVNYWRYPDPSVPRVEQLDTTKLPYVVDGCQPLKNWVTLHNHELLSDILDRPSRVPKMCGLADVFFSM